VKFVKLRGFRGGRRARRRTGGRGCDAKGYTAGQDNRRSRRAAQGLAVPANATDFSLTRRRHPLRPPQLAQQEVPRRAWSPTGPECLRMKGRVGPPPTALDRGTNSAICAHSSAYPDQEISFISYARESASKSMERIHAAPSTASTIRPTAREGSRDPTPQPRAAICSSMTRDRRADRGRHARRRDVQTSLSKYDIKLSLQGGAPRATAATRCARADGILPQQVK